MRFVPRIPRSTADLSRGIKDWPAFLKGALSIILSVAGIYLVLGWTSDITALYIPDRYEAKLFKWVAADKKKQDAPELVRARTLFQRLLVRSDLRELPYHLFLMKSKKPNAFAIPGGGVALTKGLVQEVESDAGLALVIGHELGHHQHRDALRGLGRMLLLQVAMSLCFGESRNIDAAQTILKAAEAGHSRARERRADEFGLRLAHATFGHQEGEFEFFERLVKEGKNGDSRWNAFFLSHPYMPDRIAYLKKLDAELLARESR
ncbi:MAG: M48 family metallopeptidase [Elusimicrobiota bacterium]